MLVMAPLYTSVEGLPTVGCFQAAMPLLERISTLVEVAREHSVAAIEVWSSAMSYGTLKDCELLEEIVCGADAQEWKPHFVEVYDRFSYERFIVYPSGEFCFSCYIRYTEWTIETERMMVDDLIAANRARWEVKE